MLSEQYLPGNPVRCCATPHNALHDDVMLLSTECHTGMCHLLPWRLWGKLSRTAPCSCSATMTSSMRSSSSHAISLRYTFLLRPKAVNQLVFVFITQHLTCLYLGLTCLPSSYCCTLHRKPASCKAEFVAMPQPANPICFTGSRSRVEGLQRQPKQWDSGQA